jgi:hypothetical protein
LYLNRKVKAVVKEKAVDNTYERALYAVRALTGSSASDAVV